MKKPLRQLLPLGALSIGLCLLAPATFAEKNDAEKLKALKQSIEQLRNDLKEVRSLRSDVQDSLRQSEEEINGLTKKIEKIKGQLKNEKGQLKEMEQEKKQLNDARRQQQQQIRQQVQAAYASGTDSNLKLLLNQENPEKVARMTAYYDHFLQARADQISTYLATINKIETLEPQTQEKAQRLEAMRGKLQGEQHKLLASKTERQRALARLNKAIRTKADQLKQLQKDRQRLEKVLAAVKKAIGNIRLPETFKPFKTRRGKMTWPVTGKLRQRFGTRRGEGQLRWQGVVIGAKEGQPVKAVHHGRVVFSDWLRGHGLLIIIDHGDGYMSLYGHNQTLLKETGDWIAPGETISTVGNTGGQTQSGLYFEIRSKGQPTNPAKWCKSA